MIFTDKLLEFQKNVGYNFKDIELLRLALTHKSYAYEFDDDRKEKYNERIEFLGDAILEHIISDMLFNIEPKISEGEMTKKRAAIVCEASLSSAMRRIKGDNCIFLGKCEKPSRGKVKDAIVADAFEAVLGAIYIDAGYDKARNICLNLLEKEIDLVIKGGNLNTDYKTKLQEVLQKNGNVEIKYITIKEEGPEHDKSFTVELLFNGKKIGQGVGKNKKQAEQEAAKEALKKYE